MDTELHEAAKAVRFHAYAPYSGYAVGAALRDNQGQIHVGTNVENVSYGLTVCAERSAVSRMIAEGGSRIRELALVTRDGGTPCGMCLQVLAEFAESPSMPIVCFAEDGSARSFVLSEMMPHAFASDAVPRTQRPV